MATVGPFSATKLSTQSPVFNPRIGTPSRTREAPANPNSNAIDKYSFEYNGQTVEIRNVWKENVEEEMANIRQVIEKYPYVAMDTEFPGVVAKPVTETYSPDYHYKSLKVNVDLLKIIQLGLSFADEDGNFAPQVSN